MAKKQTSIVKKSFVNDNKKSPILYLLKIF